MELATPLTPKEPAIITMTNRKDGKDRFYGSLFINTSVSTSVSIRAASFNNA
jgi:hypothetical protein